MTCAAALTLGCSAGTVGFRPTRDCYNSAGGIVPMTTSRDTVGVMTRTVADASMFDAIFSDCPSTRPAKKIQVKGLRIGLPKQWWQGNGKEVCFASHAHDTDE